MSPRPTDKRLVDVGFPRVSGDEPAGSHAGAQGIRFSPRERG